MLGLPAVAADSKGNIAIVYDEIDTSRVLCGEKPVVPTRTVVVVSIDGGHHWQSVTIGAPWWNFAARGKFPPESHDVYWVGEYQAIASTPEGFITATPQGPALAGREPTGGISGVFSIIAGEIAVGPPQ